MIKGFSGILSFLWTLLLFSTLTLKETNAQIVEWDGCEKFLGNVSASTTPNNWLKYWNQVTPENAGKWGSVESVRDQMSWSGLDRAYNLAKDNGYPFKQHVFVWGNQQPNWIASLPDEEQLEEITEWIQLFCERYPDTDMIEVVNEPLHDPPDSNEDGNYMKALGGSGTTGWDWIIKAFEIAKEHCPNAALIINEYGILNNSNDRHRYLGIVDLLIERDLIDAIGVQGHAFTVNNMSAGDINTALNNLSSRDLPLYVTELDIDTEGYSGTDYDDEQLRRYQEIFPAIWEHEHVDGVTLWGYVQNQMWRSGAYLVSNGTTSATERPALKWLQDYVTKGNSNCLISSIGGFNNSMGLSIYPNPINHTKFVVNSKTTIHRIEIRDLNGKVVMDLEPLDLECRNLEVEFDGVNGIYILEVFGSVTSDTRRLLIQ